MRYGKSRRKRKERTKESEKQSVSARSRKEGEERVYGPTIVKMPSPLYASYFVLTFILWPANLCALKCYECDNELTNNFCMSDLNLHSCEQGLDTCQTIVAYSEVSEKLSIIKTCSVNASCHTQMQENTDLPCDKHRSSWVCTSCCHEDGCNISGQDRAQPISTFFVTLLSVVVAVAALFDIGQLQFAQST